MVRNAHVEQPSGCHEGQSEQGEVSHECIKNFFIECHANYSRDTRKKIHKKQFFLSVSTSVPQKAQMAYFSFEPLFWAFQGYSAPVAQSAHLREPLLILSFFLAILAIFWQLHLY